MTSLLSWSNGGLVNGPTPSDSTVSSLAPIIIKGLFFCHEVITGSVPLSATTNVTAMY